MAEHKTTAGMLLMASVDKGIEREDELATLRTRLRQLEAALKPFADVDVKADIPNHHLVLYALFSARAFRNARTALQEQPDGE